MIASRRSLAFGALAAALLFTPLAIGAAGDLDRTFDGDGKVVTDVGGDDYGSDVAVQNDGKVVLVGSSFGPNTSKFVVARYTSNGALDSTFGGGGIVRPELGTFSLGYAVAIQADGKIVVAGQGSLPGRSADFALARYNADGSLDASFDGDGRVFTDFGFFDSAIGLAIQPDGKIIAAGLARTSFSRDSHEFSVARYNPDGGLDASFDGDGRVITAMTPLTDIAADVVVQPDGKIVVGGQANYTFDPPNTSDSGLARYNSDGSLDTGFDGDGKVLTAGTPAEDVALQPDGKILIAALGITRYTRQGSIDSSFGFAGKLAPTSMVVRALLVQPDAKIIAVGVSSRNNFSIMRLDSKGSVDLSFGGGWVETEMGVGVIGVPHAAALQGEQRIVVAGRAGVSGQPFDFAAVRYLNPAPPQCVVPNVRGKTLRIARRTVARGRCAAGRVTRKFSKRVRKGRVISQSRRPGLRLPVGSRVNLVISKGRPRSR